MIKRKSVHKYKHKVKHTKRRKYRKSAPEKLLHAQVLSGSSANILGGFKW